MNEENKYLNVWLSKPYEPRFTTLAGPIFEIGEYKIFGENKNYHYTRNNICINQLGGLNKEYLKSLHEQKRPTDTMRFLFDRANQIYKRGTEILKTI